MSDCNPTDATQTAMYREAAEAGQVVRLQLQANRQQMMKLGAWFRQHPPAAVVTCARGSSDHAATFGKYLFESRLGILTAKAAMAVTTQYQSVPFTRDMLLVAISQSGKSPDLLMTVDKARAAGCSVLAITNDPQSPLAQKAQHLIGLHAGGEKSVAATKSFIASCTALLHLAACWNGEAQWLQALEELPEQLDAAFRIDIDPVIPAFQRMDNLFVTGRGYGMAIALEVALKCQETCGIHASAFSAAELQHGPMALVDKGFPVWALLQGDETLGGVSSLVQDFIQRGANLLTLGESFDHTLNVSLPHCNLPAMLPLLQVQVLYKCINALSMARGYNPDQPPWLNKVTETL